MAKAQYIPIYYRDFLHGTKTFTTEEIGAYVLLLFEQWDNGAIPDDDKILKKICGISPKKLQNILKKFKKNENGQLQNERLEIEKLKYFKFINKQSQNGLQSANKRKKGNHGSNLVTTTTPTIDQPESNQPQPDNTNVLSNHNQNQQHSNECSALPPENRLASAAGNEPLLAPNRPQHSPSWQAVQEFFFQMGQSGQALSFFEYHEGLGWMKGITPIQNWRSFANRWVGSDISQKQATAAAANPTGRIAVMSHFMGAEVEWTEAELERYRSANGDGYTFLKWKN